MFFVKMETQESMNKRDRILWETQNVALDTSSYTINTINTIN